MPVTTLYKKQPGEKTRFMRTRGTEPVMSYAPGRPSTSEHLSEARQSLPSPLCWTMFVLDQENSIEITQHCEQLTNVDDIIAEFRSTDEGSRLWEEADKEFENELWQRVEEGTVSKIRFHRIIRGIDQKTLARNAGLHQSNLSRSEQVGQNVTLTTYKKIAKALNMDYKELLP